MSYILTVGKLSLTNHSLIQIAGFKGNHKLKCSMSYFRYINTYVQVKLDQHVAKQRVFVGLREKFKTPEPPPASQLCASQMCAIQLFVSQLFVSQLCASPLLASYKGGRGAIVKASADRVTSSLHLYSCPRIMLFMTFSMSNN